MENYIACSPLKEREKREKPQSIVGLWAIPNHNLSSQPDPNSNEFEVYDRRSDELARERPENLKTGTGL